MLLDLTLLDIDFYKYQKNTIVFSICFLILCNYSMLNYMTDNFESFINIKEKDNYKLNIYFSPDTNTINGEGLLEPYTINIINYLFSFYPNNNISLVFECCKKIVNLYEKMRESKYNSAIQKYFIQLKEIKDENIFEQSNELIKNNNHPSFLSNFTKRQNNETNEELDGNINMIIID